MASNNQNQNQKKQLKQIAALSGIAFQMGKMYPKIAKGSPFNICYSLQENEYMGKVETQMMIRDLKIS